MKTPLDSVLFEVSSKCREIITYINKWSKGNKLRGMSFKELDRLSDSLFDYEDELDEYEGKLTSLIAATPQGFAARQEDIDYLMTVIGRVRNTIINMQEAVDKTIGITTSDEEEEYFDPDDKAQLEKLFNSKTVKDAIEKIKKDRLDAMDEAIRAEKEEGPFKYQPASPSIPPNTLP